MCAFSTRPSTWRGRRCCSCRCWLLPRQSTLDHCQLMLVKLRRGFLSPSQTQAMVQSQAAMQAHAADVDASAVATAVDGFVRGLQEEQSPDSPKNRGLQGRSAKT